MVAMLNLVKEEEVYNTGNTSIPRGRLCVESKLDYIFSYIPVILSLPSSSLLFSLSLLFFLSLSLFFFLSLFLSLSCSSKGPPHACSKCR
jgi:hypothetical protein